MIDRMGGYKSAPKIANLINSNKFKDIKRR